MPTAAPKSSKSKPAPKVTPPPSMPPKGGGKSKPPAKRAEVDPKKLSAADAQKRCGVTYRLQKAIDGARKLDTLAKQNAKNAKAKLVAAEDALAKEIDEQRFGPGPLYDPTGKGPAK